MSGASGIGSGFLRMVDDRGKLAAGMTRWHGAADSWAKAVTPGGGLSLCPSTHSLASGQHQFQERVNSGEASSPCWVRSESIDRGPVSQVVLETQACWL